MLGYTVEEMMGRPLADFTFAEDAPEIAAAQARRTDGQSENFDFRYRRKDGAELWAHISTTPLRNEAGEFAGALGLLTDITARRRTERALHENEERLRLATEAAQLGAWERDLVTRRLIASAQLKAIYGFAPDADFMSPARLGAGASS